MTGRGGEGEGRGPAQNHEVVASQRPGLRLTKERVLQAQETVILGGSHFLGLVCSGGCRVEISSSSLGWRNEVYYWYGGVVEVLGPEDSSVGCKQNLAIVSSGFNGRGKSGQRLGKWNGHVE